jgi:hypothetical protein
MISDAAPVNILKQRYNMRLKDYYGPPEVEQGLIDAIMRGERPQGMGPEFVIDDDDDGSTRSRRTTASGGVKPSGMMPKINMRSR